MKTVVLGQKGGASLALIKTARTEKNLQKWLDSAQLAIRNGEVSLSKAVEQAKKELATISENRAKLRQFGIQSVADYKPLRTLYEGSLKVLTLESLVADYAIKAKAKTAQLIDATDGQKEVIAKYFELKAQQEYQIVSQVRNVLEAVGETVKVKVFEEAVTE